MNAHFTPRGWLFLILLFVSFGGIQGQGVTSGTFFGVVESDSGEPLEGATVLVVHTPTGTQYGAISREGGRYVISNARVGGPYSVSATYVGYRADRKSDLYLNLGQRYQVNLLLSQADVQLDEVTISASTGRLASQRTGAETVITESQIDAMPTVSRSFGDFVRLTPQARVTEGSDGFAISLNGMNNRYNAIYIDGAVNNDVFGLSGSGTNGGQTGVSPISLDAIQEIQVSLAPFDVRVGGFAGGAINTITRSGTNDYIASAYGFYRNQSLAGLTPTDNGGARTALPDFTALTSGFRVGGPIIKNKLFFFVNAEVQRQETPLPYSFATYQGSSTENDLNTLRAKILTLGYDPGSFTNNRSFLNSDKVTIKLDYNFNAKNSLSLRHSYVGATNLEGIQSNARSIRFANSAEYFASTTNSTALELNSTLSSNWTNNLKVGLTLVSDDRDPYQGDGTQSESNPKYFPYLQINDGLGTITLGSEPFSTANALDQTIITLTNNLTYNAGSHVVTFGTHNEFFDVYNLFIRENFGSYQYNSLEDVITDQPANTYSRSYSLVDGLVGDGSAAASQFMGAQFGVYVQDDWTVARNFTLTPGIRFDMPIYFDSPALNPDFNDRTIPLLEAAGYDLQGAQTGTFIKPRLMISPRIGFNWDVKGDLSTTIRGGVGVFTSRIPLVWPGGAFVNNGISVGGDLIRNPAFGISDFPRWNEQPQTILPNSGSTSGQIDLFASNFRVPQVLKFNVALDQKLPWGVIGNVDLIYNKTLNNVAYQNLNLTEPIYQLEGTGDNRPIYNRGSLVDPTYSQIFLGYNTSRGYSWNFTVSLSKPFTKGLSGTVAYSYGDSWAVFDGTSSQNSSQWRGLQTVQGRNVQQDATRSDFSQGHRMLGSLAYTFKWLKNDMLGTTFSLFYEGASGQPFSYIYDSFGANGELNGEDSRERSLIYVPVNQDDIFFGVIDDRGTSSRNDDIVLPMPQDQADLMYASLNDFIENDPYLSSRRGQYAERNQSRSPFSHVLDARLMQDVSITLGKRTHKLQLTADVFNLTNLINPEWGRRYFVGNDANIELLDFIGYLNEPAAQGQYLQTQVPVFTFPGAPDFSIDDSGIQSSRWQMQLGVRYIFQ
ncbi:MAG: TonB-dependent receptor [Bacteroidia bacterium]|nr:TonB-dependent receptor [Bacteroidia bacterium]